MNVTGLLVECLEDDFVYIENLRLNLIQQTVNRFDVCLVDFALVLMDLKMPVMDGLEATRQIKAAKADLPIIALTANAFDSDRQQAFDAGCDNFMSKPVSAEKCLKLIAEYVG